MFNRLQRCLGLALLLSLVLASTTSVAAKTRKPNLIFFICDDLGYGDIGAYGQTKIRTPNLDRLAAEGMKFTQHYSGSPVCAPSRCVLMTGKHPGHAFIRDNREMKPEGQYPIPAETVTIAKLLKQAGYATGAFGKWGLGGPDTNGQPLKQGFDRFYGYNCQHVAHNLFPEYLWDNDRRVPLNNPPIGYKAKLPPDADPNDPESYKRYVGKEYAPDLYSEQALQFIRTNKDNPFFLYYPTIIPHLALQVPEDSLAEYAGKLEDKPYPGGNGYLPHHKPHAAYAAMITRMDREVGRMLSLLKELGLDEDTIVIFTSDNGPAPQDLGGTDAAFFNSNGPLRDGKGSIYDGGIRVPLLVRWPGRIKGGSISERVTGFEDWLPTLLELAGAKTRIPADVDGISFAKTLFGKKIKERPFLYREFPGYNGQQALWIDDWKAVRQNLKPKSGAAPDLRIELYNLKQDIGESRNLAAEHPEIIARMEKLMWKEHVPSKDFPFPALDQQ
jgi:arylsulfatase A